MVDSLTFLVLSDHTSPVSASIIVLKHEVLTHSTNVGT